MKAKNPVVMREGTPPTPPSGHVALYSTDGSVLLMKDDAGNVTTFGGGGGGGSGTELAATSDYSTTTPTAPTTGLKIFARNRARRVPAFIGPSGQDSQLQPALFSNRVARLQAINNTAAMTGDGFPVPTVYTTASTAVLNASTNFYTAMLRTRFPSASTAGSFAGFRIPNPQYFFSSTANMGGFFFVARFGINLGTATARAFIGLNQNGANDTNADPNTLTNRVGFGFGTASTNWYFHSSGVGSNTAVTDLGASFPARTYATDFYEFRLFAPSGAGTTLYWSAQKLNDGTFVQGGPITTNLPIGALTPHMWLNNGTTATAVSMDVQSLYVETDN